MKTLSAWYHSQSPTVRMVVLVVALTAMFVLIAAPGGGKRSGV